MVMHRVIRRWVGLVWLLSATLPFLWGRENFVKFERLGIEQGLSQNVVSAIHQDHRGFLWLGTQDGLNRYDGHEFVVYRPVPLDPGAISAANISSLAEDRGGRLLVGTLGGGLNVFDKARRAFTAYRHDPQRIDSLSNDLVRCITIDRQDRIWIGTDRGLNLFLEGEDRFLRFDLNQGSGDPAMVTAIRQRADQSLWVGTRNKGLLLFEPNSARVLAFPTAHDDPLGPGSRQILALALDADETLWLGTDRGFAMLPDQGTRFTHLRLPIATETAHAPVIAVNVGGDGRIWLGSQQGLFRYYPDTGLFDRFTYDYNDPYSISNDLVTTVLEDRNGLMWIGTEGGGLNKLNPAVEVFRLYRRGVGGKALGVVVGLQQDRNGAIWVGTDGSGLHRFDPQTERFKSFYHDPEDPETLSSDNLWSIDESPDGYLWISSRRGFNRFDPRTGKTRRYLPTPDFPTGFDGLYDKQGRYWFAAFGGGLVRLEADRETVTRFRAEEHNPNSLVHDFTLSLGEDPDGHLWIGTFGGGVSMLDTETNRFTNFRQDPKREDGLGDNAVVCFFSDSAGRFWLGTVQAGLHQFLPETQTFRRWDSRHGLPNSNIYAIREDRRGLLWLSTNIGLVTFSPETGEMTHYDARYNLQSQEFNQGAGLIADNGELYFGGIRGFNRFQPEDIRRNEIPPLVAITAFKKFYQNVPVDLESGEVLDIQARDSLISFEFAALDFTHPKGNRFAYQLEGFHTDWIETGAKSDVSFTNLDAGTYHLRVKAANPDGVWSDQPAVFSFRIVPPPWRSPLAFGIYALLLLLVVGSVWRLQLYRLRRARDINHRLRRLDRLKDEFLANTSHELRTPLNGIIGIAESLLEGAGGDITGLMRENLKLMVSSGRRLDHLINDILDFAKMRHKSLELQCTEVDLQAVVEVVLALCEPLAKDAQIALVNEIDPDFAPCWADENRLHQILHNLIGNAVKFTRKGKVTVKARVHQDLAIVHVIDTGIGIPEDRLDSIFESFEQIEGSASREYGGTGLGLAITQKLVNLHGGTIRVKSTLGRGSDFSFSIPLAVGQTAAKPTLVQEPDRTWHWGSEREEPEAPDYFEDEAMVSSAGADHFHVLVVDDEVVNCRVLENLLRLRGYRVTSCHGGEEVAKLVEAQGDVDLLLLDVMMPRVTGYQVLQKLRRRYSAAELPVILLTAKAGERDLALGFHLGCNDYVTKPFSKEELLARVQTQLNLRILTRDLEAVVAQRTNEIKAYVAELETMNDITKTINSEGDFEKVMNLVLEQGIALFPQASMATFMFLDESRRFFQIKAGVGYDMNDLIKGVDFPLEVALERYTRRGDSLAPGIAVIRSPRRKTVPPAFAEFPAPQSLLAMEVHLDGRLEGFLVLDNSTHPDGFKAADVARLGRFREHAVNALARAKSLNNLRDTQKELVEAAHLFGMAETATLVMHNMGNNLNSVNTSLQVLRVDLQRDRWLRNLERLDELLRAQKDIAGFFQEDPRAAHVPQLVSELTQRLYLWRKQLLFESERLEEHVQAVLKALREQRDYANIKRRLEPGDMNRILEGVLALDDALAGSVPIQVNRAFRMPPRVPVHKIQLMRVFFCLVRNAVEAVDEQAKKGDTEYEGILHIETGVITEDGVDKVFVFFEDNGIGIEPENLARVFTQGFSTKRRVKGFGLHNCANALKAMGATIELTSEGVSRGSMARLTFPVPAPD
ncbi:ATP-binding protein [Acanthopleuribacter pedis]|uniref:histidine kinase n=1 Tax=Acanthopleuribacter pedis TaxID=442870 RepID=A0A8J7QNC3_9BACT|nr:ATP-binding protein [Acanthopleuribacter pedis]MBO1321593.1 response regulator [Acanthopleuribacter pedis]